VGYNFCKQTNKVHPPSSPYITQKSTKSDSAVGEENQGKRNEMRDCAKLNTESQVFLIKTRLCIYTLWRPINEPPYSSQVTKSFWKTDEYNMPTEGTYSYLCKKIEEV
jgi:hypothetical protein